MMHGGPGGGPRGGGPGGGMGGRGFGGRPGGGREHGFGGGPMGDRNRGFGGAPRGPRGGLGGLFSGAIAGALLADLLRPPRGGWSDRRYEEDRLYQIYRDRYGVYLTTEAVDAFYRELYYDPNGHDWLVWLDVRDERDLYDILYRSGRW